MAQERQEFGSVEYEKGGEQYLKERELHRVAGPVLLWGLGVARSTRCRVPATCPPGCQR